MTDKLQRELSEILRGPISLPPVIQDPPMENSSLQLRDYQQECLQKIKESCDAGVSRQLIALPTGTGKTVIFSQIPQLFPGKKMLVLAHREELLEQAAEKIEWANPGIRVEVEKAERMASAYADVVVGSVQSLTGKYGKERLERLHPDSISTVVIDEAHHSLALTYLELLARFGKAPDLSDLEGKASSNKLNKVLNERCGSFVPNPNTLLVGFTATPHRTDGIGLHYVFEEIPFSRTIKEMMSAPAPGPWLCDIRGYRFESGLSLKGVKTQMGDYKTGELSRAVNLDERNIAAVKAYIALASGRQAICFCVDVEHSRAMLEQFTNYGVAAACIVGEDSPEDRHKAVANFKSCRSEVLTNCNVLTEGFDHAPTSCIIMARPTKSQLLYTQMLGRGTRISAGKKDLLVIDLADTDAVGVASVNTLFGLPPKMETKQKGVIETQDEFELIVEEQQLDPGMMDGAQTIDEVKQLAKQYNPLGIPSMPAYIKHRMPWSKTAFGFVLPVNQEMTVGIVMDLLDHAQVQIKKRDRQHRSSTRVEDGGNFDTASKAIEHVENMVSDRFPDDAALLDVNAGWRQRAKHEPPSDKQWNMLKWLNVKHPQDISKADASALISNALAGRNFKKEENG